jgi:hypothetical protein
LASNARAAMPGTGISSFGAGEEGASDDDDSGASDGDDDDSNVDEGLIAAASPAAAMPAAGMPSNAASASGSGSSSVLTRSTSTRSDGSAGQTALLRTTALAYADRIAQRSTKRLPVKCISEYTAGSVPLVVDGSHRNGQRNADAAVAEAQHPADMMRGLRPYLASLAPGLQRDVARTASVTYQAGLAATNPWNMRTIATHAAAAIGPQLPPRGPRQRPLISASQSLCDARESAAQSFRFGPQPPRRALFHCEELQELAADAMRYRVSRRAIQRLFAYGTDPRNTPAEAKEPVRKLTLVELCVFLMVIATNTSSSTSCRRWS